MRPVKEPQRSDFTGERLEFYDKLMELPQRKSQIPLNPTQPLYEFTRAILHTPRVIYYWQKFANALREEATGRETYTHFEREWTEEVLLFYFDYYASQEVHIHDGIYHGCRPEALKALAEGRDDLLTDDELLLATFTRQAADGNVTDEIWNAIEERNGVKGAVELGLYVLSCVFAQRSLQLFGSTRGPDRAEILARINEYVDGTRPLPTEPIVPVPAAPK